MKEASHGLGRLQQCLLLTDPELLHMELGVNGDGALLYSIWSIVIKVKCTDLHYLRQRFSNFFQVGTTFISQNVLRTTLLLGLTNSLGLP